MEKIRNYHVISAAILKNANLGTFLKEIFD